MKTKAEKKARKEAKTAEWLGIFIRSYEMERAYGNSIEFSLRIAIKEMNSAILKDWNAVPQDRSFFIDCKMMVVGQLEAAVANRRNKNEIRG